MDKKKKVIIKTNHFTTIWSVKEALRKKYFNFQKKFDTSVVLNTYLQSAHIKVHMYMYIKVYKNS